jgi:CheY-like chemotaxis protein
MPSVNADENTTVVATAEPTEALAPVEAPASVPETVPHTDSHTIYSAGDVRILVIDDDPLVGRLIDAALSDNEFQIDVINDPQEVLAGLRKQTYHVIVLDYVLPGLDSTEVLKQVQEIQPTANLIVVTAFPSIDSAMLCLRARTFDYITKPFPVDHLKKTVLRSLESRGLLRLSEEALREKLGLAIRERRKSLSLTLSDVSKRTGISLGYLSQIELGKNSASIETLYRIALGLRVRVSDLFQAVQSSL